MSSCVACGAGLEAFGRRGAWVYACCPACRTVQLDPQPPHEQLAALYDEQYVSAGHYEGTPEQAFWAYEPFYRRAFEVLARHAPLSGARVLDYGCGFGGLAEVAREVGARFTGVDVSRHFLRSCAARGLDVRAIDELRRERFDAVISLNVLCQVTAHDAVLPRLRGWLERGGHLVIQVPTSPHVRWFARSWGAGRSGVSELRALYQSLDAPWKTVLFSVAGFERLLERHGFELLRVYSGTYSRTPGRAFMLLKAAVTAAGRAGFAAFGPGFPLAVSNVFVARAR